jgi:DNA-binding NarL/FixJ family response regulator
MTETRWEIDMLLKTPEKTGPMRKDAKEVGPTGRGKQGRNQASNATIKVLLVDGHEEARAAVAGYLANEPDLAVLSPCGKVAEAVANAKTHAPDVVLINVVLTDGDGFAAAEAIQTAYPEIRIIFLATEASDELIARALELKVRGILGTQDSLSMLPAAIREVMGGGTCFSEEIRARLIIGSEGVRLAKRSK